MQIAPKCSLLFVEFFTMLDVHVCKIVVLFFFQFNKANGMGTPAATPCKHKRSKSLGDSIKVKLMKISCRRWSHAYLTILNTGNI